MLALGGSEWRWRRCGVGRGGGSVVCVARLLSSEFSRARVSLRFRKPAPVAVISQILRARRGRLYDERALGPASGCG